MPGIGSNWRPDPGSYPRAGRTEAAVLQVMARVITDGERPTIGVIHALCDQGPVDVLECFRPDPVRFDVRPRPGLAHRGLTRFKAAEFIWNTVDGWGWREALDEVKALEVGQLECFGDTLQVERVEDLPAETWHPSRSTIQCRLRDLKIRGLIKRGPMEVGTGCNTYLLTQRGWKYAQKLLLSRNRVVLP